MGSFEAWCGWERAWDYSRSLGMILSPRTNSVAWFKHFIFVVSFILFFELFCCCSFVSFLLRQSNPDRCLYYWISVISPTWSLSVELWPTRDFVVLLGEDIWRELGDPTIEKPILMALQHLFANLSLSDQVSLSTKDLTDSFGWHAVCVWLVANDFAVLILLFAVLSCGLVHRKNPINMLKWLGTCSKPVKS